MFYTGTLNIGNNFEVDMAGNLKAFVPRFYSSINLSPASSLGSEDAQTVMQLIAANHLSLGSGDMSIWTSQKMWLDDVTVMGDLSVIGTKSNAVKMEGYGTRTFVRQRSTKAFICG